MILRKPLENLRKVYVGINSSNQDHEFTENQIDVNVRTYEIKEFNNGLVNP